MTDREIPQKAPEVLPEIVQTASNLTSMRVTNYVQLDLEPKTPGTRFIAEGMNLSGVPAFAGGGLPKPWKVLTDPGSSYAYAITPLSAFPASTAGVSLTEHGNPLLFVAELLGPVRMTTTMVRRVMTQAKQRVLQSRSSGLWMKAVFGRSASRVYGRMNYREYGGALCAVLPDACA